MNMCKKKTTNDFYDYLFVKLGLGNITVGGYRRVLSKVVSDLGTDRPTKDTVEKYIADMRRDGYSYSHVRNTMLILERYMEFIGRKTLFTRPRRPKLMPKEVLTEGEIARIIAATKNSRERAILSVLAYSGIRNKELCGLKVRDIDFDNSILKIYDGKNSKDGVSQISKECCKSVSEYIGEYKREHNDYLFATIANNRKYSGWSLRKLVKGVSRKAGIVKRVYPHLFRHSLATCLLNRGANIMSIQSQLRHNNLNTTLIYAQLLPQRVAQEYQFFCPKFI